MKNFLNQQIETNAAQIRMYLWDIVRYIKTAQYSDSPVVKRHYWVMAENVAVSRIPAESYMVVKEQMACKKNLYKDLIEKAVSSALIAA